MPILPDDVSEGDEISAEQWQRVIDWLRTWEDVPLPLPQTHVELYELTATMEKDTTANQWKATAKPVYRHPINQTYEIDSNAVEETIWAPCVEQVVNEAIDAAPFHAGDRVFTYMLYAHREIVHQSREIHRFELKENDVLWPEDNSVQAYLVDDPEETEITLYRPEAPGYDHQTSIGRGGYVDPNYGGGTKGYCLWQPVRQKWEIVVLDGILILKGKSDDTIAEDATGTISIWWRNNLGNVADSNHNVEALNWCGPTVDPGEKVIVEYDRSSDAWTIIEIDHAAY